MEKSYTTPKIETIEIDNEISVIMMSTPPGDPEASIHQNINPNKEEHFVA